jgi:hypothetical protein
MVVKGKNKKPRHGTIAVLNVAFHATGREIHIVNNAMRENKDTNAVKQPPEDRFRIATLLVLRQAFAYGTACSLRRWRLR